MQEIMLASKCILNRAFPKILCTLYSTCIIVIFCIVSHLCITTAPFFHENSQQLLICFGTNTQTSSICSNMQSIFVSFREHSEIAILGRGVDDLLGKDSKI